MSVRIIDDCLYIILDFEGLGSPERSEGEDMLLSLCNAAISSITLFKTDYRIDRDTEATFSKFQEGVGRLKEAGKYFFQGKFCIIVRDVATSQDRSDLDKEFQSKLDAIVKKYKNQNFLSQVT